MKKVLYITLFFLLAGVILYYSIFEEKKTKVKYDNTKDVTLNVKINNNDLGVTFYGGNLIKEDITYGNKIEKIIKIENTHNEILVVALAIKDTRLSNEYLTYNLSYSDTLDGKYKDLVKENTLKSDMNLGYNLGVESKSVVYFKLEIISNYEVDTTSVELKLDVVDNLTKKELFIINVDKVIKQLEEKIKKLNGITDAGYYYYKVSDDLKGIIIIDASDISDLKYNLYLYDNNLMIKGTKYHEINKNKIVSLDKNYVEDIKEDTTCKLITKKKCEDFNTIKYNSKGGKEVFHKDLKDVLDEVKKVHHQRNQNIVYDVSKDIKNETGVSGYVLVNSKNEYFLYLKNELYMVSGYNLTKYGDFDSNSVTIRAYNKTAFHLCAKDMNTVCTFSGYKDCITKDGKKI